MNLLGAIQGGDFNFAPEGSHGKRYGDATNNIVPFPLEKLVGINIDNDVQITLRATPFPFLPFSSQPETGTSIHPGGNLKRNLLPLLCQPRPSTCLARI